MRKGIREIVKSLRVLWTLDRKLVLVIFFQSLIQSLSPYAGILLSAYVVNELTAGGDTKRLILTAGLVAGIVFLLSVMNAQLEKVKQVRGELCSRIFYEKRSERTLTMDYELLESPKVNAIRERIRQDHEFGAGFYSIIFQLPWLLSSFISFIAAIAVIFQLFVNWQSASGTPLLALGAFAAALLASLLVGPASKRRVHSWMDSHSVDKSYRAYFLFGRHVKYQAGKDIRLYGMKRLIESCLDRDPPLRDDIMGITAIRMRGSIIKSMLSGLMMVTAYLFVVMHAVSGALGVGSVLLYASTVYKFAEAMTDMISSFSEYRLSARRQLSTLEYMNIPDVLPKGTLPVEKRALCENGDMDYVLEFHDVSFRYPGADAWALRHVSFTLKVGEHLAIVGQNGSGKTTFIKLLCRLYDPTEGEITLNGVDIRKYDYAEYMSIFSVVFQDFRLFSLPLGQNVASGVDVDRERAADSLEKAGFGERLNSLTKGLETCLYQDFDDEGVEISGGEAQKIALARALYKQAPFIILDEPTAALDPVAEYDIYTRFNEMVGKRTAVYISHRLSSCRFCNEILVFDHGQIVQRGGHEELLREENGKYAQLWHAQAKYYQESSEEDG